MGWIPPQTVYPTAGGDAHCDPPPPGRLQAELEAKTSSFQILGVSSFVRTGRRGYVCTYEGWSSQWWQLHNLYSLRNIIRVGDDARAWLTWEVRSPTKLWMESLKGREHSEDVDVGESLILQWILGTQGWEIWIWSIGLRTGTGGGTR
jgi:hypothetical protein